MKSIRHFFQSVRIVSAATLLITLLVAPGCESDKSTVDVEGDLESNPYRSLTREDPAVQALTVSPSDVTATRVGQEFVFTASGGYPLYSWRVADPAAGSLSINRSGAAVYRVLQVGPNEVIVTDRRGHAVMARVNGVIPVLAATASPATLENDGDNAILTAEGGSPPYQWSVVDVSLGHLVGTATGASVVYVRDHAGDNVARVRDANNTIVHVLIRQP